SGGHPRPRHDAGARHAAGRGEGGGRRVPRERAAARALIGWQGLHRTRVDRDADASRRDAADRPRPAQAPRLRQADRGRAAVSLKGSTAEFPLDALLRLLADTKKTGELSLRAAAGEGALGIAEGKVVTAVYGEDLPIPALGAIFAMGECEFEFTPWADAPP